MATSQRTQRASYACTECGWTTAKWVGRCGECQIWGSVTSTAEERAGSTKAVAPRVRAQPITDIGTDHAAARPTGLSELDRVLGGGLVPGAVILLTGEPGVGKSTLLLNVAAAVARQGTVLYVSGEESASQVRLRAERVGALHPQLLLAAETDLGSVLGHIADHTPTLLVVDSVQTISSSAIDGQPGNVSQVKEVTGALVRAAKEQAITTIVVGHVTKDGTVAGPRTLEHIVDVVCQFDGERHSRLRTIRALKNRYGPTDDMGCFEMTDAGVVNVTDPSGLFLSHGTSQSPGSCVTVTLEGRRPLAVEIQGLVCESHAPPPRRASSGIDSSRMAMIVAVLSARVGVPVGGKDLFVSTVGGGRLGEPAADLAMALAIASAAAGQPVATGTIAIGEVSLSGDIRPVEGLARRLSEASRLGFSRALIPRTQSGEKMPRGGRLELVEVSNLGEAVAVAWEGNPQTRPSTRVDQRKSR